MNLGDLAWWMAAIAIAVPVLMSARSGVSKRQRELRGQLREVLRDVSKACDQYVIADWRRSASAVLRDASEKLKVIHDEGILSPSPRQVHELQQSLWDLATRDEANEKITAYLRGGMSPEQRAQSLRGFADSTETLLRYVTRLAAKYGAVTRKMDNGNILTYWRYRLLPPFIVRR
jgi:hypothetical protein